MGKEFESFLEDYKKEQSNTVAKIVLSLFFAIGNIFIRPYAIMYVYNLFMPIIYGMNKISFGHTFCLSLLLSMIVYKYDEKDSETNLKKQTNIFFVYLISIGIAMIYARYLL